MGALLEVKNLNVYYGVIHALKDVSFHVNKGEVESRECPDTKLYQWAWRRFPRGDVFLRI